MLIVSILFGQGTGAEQGKVVQACVHRGIEEYGHGAAKGNFQENQNIRKPLDAQADGAQLHACPSGFGQGVHGAVHNLIEKAHRVLHRSVEAIPVEGAQVVVHVEEKLGLPTGQNEIGKTDGGQVADGRVVLVTVEGDLHTEVQVCQGTHVQLVAVAVHAVLENDTGFPGPLLVVDDGLYEIGGRDLARVELPGLGLVVDPLEVLAPGGHQGGHHIGGKEGPHDPG